MIVNFSFINPREPTFDSFYSCVNRIYIGNKKLASTIDGQKEVSGFLEQPKLSFLYPPRGYQRSVNSFSEY